jgi:hypothetical protein
LTVREELFCSAYLAEKCNGAAAARAAGYTGKNVAVTASQLLRRPNVATKINELITATAMQADITTEENLRALIRMLRFDPAALFEPGGRLKPVPALDIDTRMAISIDVTIDKRGRARTRIKGPNKLIATAQLCTYFALMKVAEAPPEVPTFAFADGTEGPSAW